jgi:hypothetical protein
LQSSLIGAATTILFPSQSEASLLDEYGGTEMTIQPPIKTERIAAVAQPKAVSNMEPNLRSNYYYPTNKKRYLPRIKKCNDAIPQVAEAIGTEQWDSAEEFVSKIADDTILPMKLYTSSLLGGGTNVKVAFAQDMKKATNDFEKAQKKLTKAIAKRDRELSSKALEDLASALQLYRESGRLTGPDGTNEKYVECISLNVCLYTHYYYDYYNCYFFLFIQAEETFHQWMKSDEAHVVYKGEPLSKRLKIVIPDSSKTLLVQ